MESLGGIFIENMSSCKLTQKVEHEEDKNGTQGNKATFEGNLKCFGWSHSPVCYTYSGAAVHHTKLDVVCTCICIFRMLDGLEAFFILISLACHVLSCVRYQVWFSLRNPCRTFWGLCVNKWNSLSIHCAVVDLEQTDSLQYFTILGYGFILGEKLNWKGDWILDVSYGYLTTLGKR